MEVKKYATVIKKEHELAGNEYIEGRISGIMYMTCGGEELPHEGYKFGKVLITNCTREAYAKFKEIISSMYPGLCKFTEEY